jgi:hypothetical protein
VAGALVHLSRRGQPGFDRWRPYGPEPARPVTEVEAIEQAWHSCPNRCGWQDRAPVDLEVPRLQPARADGAASGVGVLSLDISTAPLVPVEFRKGDLALCYFSALTSLVTPHDITRQELRIERSVRPTRRPSTRRAAWLQADRRRLALTPAPPTRGPRSLDPAENPATRGK